MGTTPRIHQRMEKTTIQGGRITQKAKGKASQEKGNQSRTRKEIGSTKEGRGRTIKKGRSRQKSQRGRRKEKTLGRGRKEETSHDASTKGKATSCWTRSQGTKENRQWYGQCPRCSP